MKSETENLIEDAKNLLVRLIMAGRWDAISHMNQCCKSLESDSMGFSADQKPENRQNRVK